VGKSNSRVAALTGARALAGLYILLLHFGAPLLVRAPAWVRTLRESGYVATSFFLMLSGFVLTVVYGDRLGDGRLDRRGFLAQRVARLYPCYALALALMVPFAIVHRWGSVTSAFADASLRYKIVTGVAHATMTHVWAPPLVPSWNVPDWCVSIEMWFYVAFPLVVGWMLTRRRRTLVLALAGTYALALALDIAYTVVEPDGISASRESFAFWLSLYKFAPYARWPEFVFGVALGALWLRTPAAARGARWATPLVAGGAGAALVVLLYGDRIPYTLLHNGTLLPLYGAVVWGLMLGGRGPLHRALSVRPLTAMGDASYVLYLLQVPVMQWLVLAGGRQYGGGVDAAFTALALPIVIAVALAVHHVYEKPAQAWLRPRLQRLVARRPTPTPVPATLQAAR
jgi:peptidoglycan/LPS O-acetylase OafA/YrhL